MLKLANRKQRKVIGLAGAVLVAFTTSALGASFNSSELKSVTIRSETGTTTFNENNLFATVDGMFASPFTVLEADTELFVVTFSAQVELKNSSVNGATFNADDVLEIKVEAVNTNTDAVIDFTPSFAGFGSSRSAASQSMQWARRIGTGSWNIRVLARLRDRAPTATVQALISARTMTIQRYD